MKKSRLILVILLMLIVSLGSYFLRVYMSKKEYVQLPSSAVWIGDEGMKSYSVGEEQQLLENGYFPLFALNDLNLFVDYDFNYDKLTITDGYHIQKIDSNNVVDVVKKDVDGRLFITAHVIDEVFGVEADYNKKTKILLIKRKNQDFFVAPLDKSAKLMVDEEMNESLTKEHNKATITKLSRFASAVIVDVNEEYIRIMTSDYQYGKVERETFSEDVILEFNARYFDKKGFFKESVYAHRANGQMKDKIFLIWDLPRKKEDFIEQADKNISVVLSKTGYKLGDASGKLAGGINSRYVKHTKKYGYLCWPLVSNDFKPERTHQFLNDVKARENFIENIRKEWKKSGYDGINIDFENVYKKDKYKLSQFIAELGAMCYQEQIMLSVDVTVMGGSDNWSKCYDRKQLGKVVDYMAVMTYDEHWATSPNSGSVASYGWVKNSIDRIRKDVPSSKILLGIPYYMRVWIEVPSKTKPRMNIKSDVLSMKHLKSYVQKHDLNMIWDDVTRQYYSAIIKDGQLKKVWYEENRSVLEKVDLVKEMDLAGVAIWRHGFENTTINQVVLEKLSKIVK